uniref:PHD-type domain-containing protein n=1 Tax=Rhodnius prolixus TaxID=13249 RepID=T1I5Q6_RHOPR
MASQVNVSKCYLCDKCDLTKNVIYCSGQCNVIVHLECLNITPNEKISLKECKQLHWLCTLCDKVEVSTCTTNLIKNMMTTISWLLEEVRDLKGKVNNNIDLASTCDCTSLISTITSEMVTITGNQLALSKEIQVLKEINKVNSEDREEKERHLLKDSSRLGTVTTQRGNYKSKKNEQLTHKETDKNLYEELCMNEITRQLSPTVKSQENLSRKVEQRCSTEKRGSSYSEAVKQEVTNLRSGEGEGWNMVKPKNDQKRIVKVGTSQSTCELVGVKKAWLHLGKLREGTTVEDVERFLKEYIPEIEISVTKLTSKGKNCSFRLGVDFHMKDRLIESDVWPSNVTIRRFLFPRRVAVLPS